MTQTRSVVRRRRSTPTIGVTGAAGPIGRALVERLAEHPGSPRRSSASTPCVEQTPGVTWRVADIRDPALASRLTGVETLVHLATDRSPSTPTEDRRAVNIRGTEVLLEAAVAAGVERVVLLTSAMVYGALPGNPVPLPEDAPHLTEPPDGLVGDWVAMEKSRCVVRRNKHRSSSPWSVRRHWSARRRTR